VDFQPAPREGCCEKAEAEKHGSAAGVGHCTGAWAAGMLGNCGVNDSSVLLTWRELSLSFVEARDVLEVTVKVRSLKIKLPSTLSQRSWPNCAPPEVDPLVSPVMSRGVVRPVKTILAMIFWVLLSPKSISVSLSRCGRNPGNSFRHPRARTWFRRDSGQPVSITRAKSFVFARTLQSPIV
jgi:hypothetical protein